MTNKYFNLKWWGLLLPTTCPTHGMRVIKKTFANKTQEYHLLQQQVHESNFVLLCKTDKLLLPNAHLADFLKLKIKFSTYFCTLKFLISRSIGLWLFCCRSCRQLVGGDTIILRLRCLSSTELTESPQNNWDIAF